MSSAGAHRRPGRTTRRALLGLGGAAAVSAVAVGLRHLPTGSHPAAAPASATPGHTTTPASALAAPAPAGSTGQAAVTRTGGGPVPFEPGRALLGAYLDLSGKSFSQSLALRTQQLGRTERIVNVFYGWTDTLPTAVPGLPAGAIPMISWRGTGYAAILDGSCDSLIRTAARRLALHAKPTFLRWGWEMNGDWYAWSGPKNDNDPAGYIACWRRLHRIFTAEGAANVAWVWSINWNSRPGTAANRFQAYYPGDAYVDWVGLSGYPLGHETPEELYDPLYIEYGKRKPVFITECGAVDFGGTSKADWIKIFSAYVAKRPAVGAVAWFDTDTHPGSDEVWRIDSDPGALAAYRAMARSPRFAG